MHSTSCNTRRASLEGTARAPANQPKDGALSEAQLQTAIRAHVAEVEAELRANREASLDLAVERYVVGANGVAGAT